MLKITRLGIVDMSTNNFLINVILKFNFKNDILVSDKMIDDIIKNIPNEFKYEVLQRSALEINFDADQQAIRQKNIKVHVFKNKHNDIISLEPNALVFDIKKYNSFDELMKIVRKVILILQETNQELTRLGLRYLNQVTLKEGTPFEWEDYISSYLTQSIKFIPSNNQYLARNIGQMVFNKSDYTLVFAYGWFNRHFPNPIAEKEFVLDYDCYSENVLNLSEAYGYIETFHREIKDIYIKSIGDKLKEGSNFV